MMHRTMKRLLVAAALLCALAPAQSRELGRSSGDGVTVVLYDDQGKCPNGAAEAKHVDAAGDVTWGCWTQRGQVLRIVYFDGDEGLMLAKSFGLQGI